ncbi:18696_t:CDS:1, partial [Racocetra fulgida]
FKKPNPNLNEINQNSAYRLTTTNEKNILLENQVHPLQATKEAMVKATFKLKIKPDLCL